MSNNHNDNFFREFCVHYSYKYISSYYKYLMSSNSDIITINVFNLISKTQRHSNDVKYYVKTPKDEIKCVLCGRCYNRQQKTGHDKSKYHQKYLNQLVELVQENLKGLEIS